MRPGRFAGLIEPAADRRYMVQALQLAERGLFSTAPNPRVGCVLVKEGRLLAEGWHRRAGEAHAEVDALARTAEDATGATLYVTLEPCCHHGRTPPCTDALIRSGICRVVCAMLDPSPKVGGRGVARLREAGIQVDVGLCTAAAQALNPGFIRRMERGRPWVRVKMAASLDGQTAMRSGESQWITGPAARADVQRLRARSCAVATGVGTVIADNPRLTVRLSEHDRQPLRVVLDSHLRTPLDSRILTGPGATLVVTTKAGGGAATALRAGGVEVVVLPVHDTRVALEAVLGALSEREINELLVEAGPTLSGAFLAAGLVDELVIYLAPKLLGEQGAPLFRIPGLETLSAHVPLRIADLRHVGRDLRLCARPDPAGGV